eukprot:gb/GECG01015374.1/.p1 GENE.gb/GECG01015374.1/~~gb/GECG01015374.1/.p1  ORF type:complete len:479 (+),score=42.62 gb/GECG01015374.1/:1-1437(+)
MSAPKTTASSSSTVEQEEEESSKHALHASHGVSEHPEEPDSFGGVVDESPSDNVHEFWLIYWDICGIFCFLFGEAVVWFASYITITKISIPLMYQANRLVFQLFIAGLTGIFQSFVILITIAHFRAMLTNPGTVKMNTAAKHEIKPDPNVRRKLVERVRNDAMKLVYQELTMRYCERCRAIKPPRAHHCSVAQRCVIRMDHNCPWVNNTVGQNNYKFFVLFILYVFIGCSLSVFLTLIRIWWCWRIGPCFRYYSTADIVMICISSILALFFAIFVASMAYDQFEGLTTDTSGVEAMKGWIEKDIPVMEGLKSYMGCDFGIKWFLPTLPDPPAIYEWTAQDKEPRFDPRDTRVRKFLANRRHALEQQRRKEQGELVHGGDNEGDQHDHRTHAATSGSGASSSQVGHQDRSAFHSSSSNSSTTSKDSDEEDEDTDEDVPAENITFTGSSMPSQSSVKSILRRQISKVNSDGVVAEFDFTK